MSKEEKEIKPDQIGKEQKTPEEVKFEEQQNIRKAKIQAFRKPPPY